MHKTFWPYITKTRKLSQNDNGIISNLRTGFLQKSADFCEEGVNGLFYTCENCVTIVFQK